MSEDVAIKGITYYLSHSKDIDELKVGFFGGEPLLNFKLIKKCIKYIIMNNNKPVKYLITTNLTVLNDEILDFLVNHGVNLSVSLEGSEEINNKYRIYNDNKITDKEMS